ncbi:MAG: agmatine deiminase family protein [Bacteroidales bacterium]|nr:agmatine deiminase family protein [Bacteroidales bacterium]
MQFWHIERDSLFTLSFDRIIDIRLTEEHFKIDKNFDAQSWFSDCYCVFRNQDTDLERVVIRAYGREAFDLRDLPFHHSQREITSGEDWTDFEYWLRISNDFYTPLLSRGPNIKVMQPQWLAEEIRQQLLKDRYGVPFSLLKGTKDIWCRDYMPLQMTNHEFVAFGYRPDYLMDTAAHRKSITDGYEVAYINGFNHVHDRRDIILDGGNTVHSGTKVILTDKVFEENPVLSHDYLCQRLRMSLGAEPLFVPWDANEIYGHTDGVVRFIDEDTVLMTNYAQLDSKMAGRFRRCLEPHFKTIHELRVDIKKPYKNNWAYINWLQTDKVLILPKFNAPEDEQAFEQISTLMPEY